MESNIDKDKLKNLNELKNILIDKEDQEMGKLNPKLIEHANFHHDFDNVSKGALVKAFLLKNAEGGDLNKIPIITNIAKKDNDTIEITRIHLFKDFYNTEPFNTEKIIINRESSNLLLLSLYEDKFKKLGTYITPEGNFTSLAKFKYFRNPEEILFNRNVFYYHYILEINKIYKFLGKIPMKKELEMKKLFYYEYLKNLF
jgi:hypothetical protein